MKEKEKGERVAFVPPKDFTMPEHESDTFDLVCTFKSEEGGKLCLVRLGDTEMPGYEEGEHEESEHGPKPDYSEYTGPMMASMGQGGGGGGGGY